MRGTGCLPPSVMICSVAYQRIDELGNGNTKTKRQRIACRWGIQRFLEAISQYGKPLVVHNGLLDLFHLYDKLIGPLPETASEIVSSFGKRFAPAVYDTKATALYLDSNGIYCFNGYAFTLSNSSRSRMFNLEHLYHELDKNAKFSETIRIGDTASALDYGSLITNPPMQKGSDRSSLDLLHEAGFDATVTAMVFTAEIRLMQDLDGLPRYCVPSYFNETIPATCANFRAVINRVNIHDEIEEGFVQLPKDQ
ncbi:CAF1 family ribonuclease [Babesia ovata]|uniref:CAF1 family ribonuclease n=1 Tax=Babesia ovata TaxID=189622 RepID=A0A2H6KF32_9APIC|nr:CAF1 family ribonuclease [Babesia ovata]GBE61601.1 CAF1 family ribonuclease [Babesia ovata]